MIGCDRFPIIVRKIKINFILLKLLFPLIILLTPLTGSGASLVTPEGKVILTVSGNIENTNSGDKAEFDITMLEALGVSSLELETPWTEGRQKFSGVLGSRILDAVGAQGEVIVARALNDYEVKIPLSDLRRYPILFALKHNGSYMRVRDKGPLWIIYPKETYPEFDKDETYEKWIWQLSGIHVQ